MWVEKKEIVELSDNIRSAIDGKTIDFRDNKEGSLSILKNDINTLVHMKEEQKSAAQQERNLLAEYLADISHQLKTPITSMMIMTDLLEGAPEDKEAEFLSNLKISLTRMEWLVSALLKMAKLDSGTADLSISSVQTAELVKSSVQPLEIMLDIKNQTIKLLNDTEVFCDQRWTTEAISNLIKNALEHSPENSTIYVDSGINPIYRWISITDSGPGIEKTQCVNAFRRFEYSTGDHGYGIGLPLALSIIRGQNGDIEIEGGGNGKGATFTIKFYK